MAPFFSLLLASLSMAVLGTEAQVSVEGMTWEKRFVLDVAADNASHVFAGRSLLHCARTCSRTAGCAMFGYQPGGPRCLLYDRVVASSSQGTAAPGTSYWGTGCPLERQYKLRSGLCFKSVEGAVSWPSARDACLLEKGQLYVADTDTKMAVLQEEMRGDWVGAMQDAGGVWRWENGSPVTQTVWSDCGTRGRCVAVDYESNFKLCSYNCSYPRYAFCEIPL